MPLPLSFPPSRPVARAPHEGPLRATGITSGTTRSALLSRERPGFRPVAALNRRDLRRSRQGLGDLFSAHLPAPRGVRTSLRGSAALAPALDQAGPPDGVREDIIVSVGHPVARVETHRRNRNACASLRCLPRSPWSGGRRRFPAASPERVALGSTASGRVFGPALGIDARVVSEPPFRGWWSVGAPIPCAGAQGRPGRLRFIRRSPRTRRGTSETWDPKVRRLHATRRTGSSSENQETRPSCADVAICRSQVISS